MSHREVYQRLAEWLRIGWWPLPEAEELMPLLLLRYTPEEAALLEGIPFLPEKRIEELAALKKMPVEDLGPRLDSLARKGLVYRSADGSSARYRLNDSFFVFLRSSFWHGRADDLTRLMAQVVNRYFLDGFFEPYARSSRKGLRTLPVLETIHEPRNVRPYEDAAQVLEAQEYFCVATCSCRHRKNLDPDSPSCKFPTDNCLHFGDLARYMVEQGLGREIARRDAREKLEEAAEVGLVHGISNWRKGIDTICNCCRCCCMWFEGVHALGHARSLDPSNYHACLTPETCEGCGLCTRRCPTGALRLEEARGEAAHPARKVAALDEKLCLGCGICAYKCPSGSLRLERREVTIDPPLTIYDYVIDFYQKSRLPQAPQHGRREGPTWHGARARQDSAVKEG